MFSLYIHIEIQKQTKFRRFKKIVDFQNSQISNFVRGKVLKIRSSISLPRGHVISHTKFGSDLFRRFDIYWIQTDKQRMDMKIDSKHF